MTVRVVRPDGFVMRPGASLTPPLASLAGLRVGVLSNNKPNAPALLQAIVAGLGERYGTVLGPVHVKNAATPYSDQVLDGILKEVEIVLTGAGD